jgi:hypothetical protein
MFFYGKQEGRPPTVVLLNKNEKQFVQGTTEQNTRHYGKISLAMSKYFGM